MITLQLELLLRLLEIAINTISFVLFLHIIIFALTLYPQELQFSLLSGLHFPQHGFWEIIVRSKIIPLLMFFSTLINYLLDGVLLL